MERRPGWMNERGWRNDGAVSYEKSPRERAIWTSKSQSGLEVHMLRCNGGEQSRILVRWGVRASE